MFPFGAQLIRPERHIQSSGLFCPCYYSITSGGGEGNGKLLAFDAALRASGIGDINFVRLSSTLSPGAVRKNPVFLPGSFVGATYAEAHSSKAGEVIGAAIAIGHSTNRSATSVIMEASGVGTAQHFRLTAIEMVTAAILARGASVRSVESLAVEHSVVKYGGVFAAVVQF